MGLQQLPETELIELWQLVSLLQGHKDQARLLEAELIYRVKGGPGSGWFGPPKGTHVAGSQGGARATGHPPTERDHRKSEWIRAQLSRGYSAGMFYRDEKDLAKRADLTVGQTDEIMVAWVNSSNNNATSLALQKNAAKEFGLSLSDFTKDKAAKYEDRESEKWDLQIGERMESQGETREEAVQFILSDPVRFSWAHQLVGDDDQRKFLRASYDKTQERLKEIGMGPEDTIRVYRGIQFTNRESFRWEKGDTIPVVGNTLESWTFSSREARGFARHVTPGNRGIVLKMEVPASMVFSTFRTGLGTYGEEEVVLFGSEPGSRAEIHGITEPWSEKGGPGSGWFAPPKGTHGAGSQGGAVRPKGGPPGTGNDVTGQVQHKLDEGEADWANEWHDPDAEDFFYGEAIRTMQENMSSTGLASAIEMRSVWSETSNDNDMRALAMQRDAAYEFGVPVSEFTQQKIESMNNDPLREAILDAKRSFGITSDEEARQLVLDYPNINPNLWPITESGEQRKILRGIYNGTQAKLKEAGMKPGDTVRLYRGMQLEPEVTKNWKQGDTIPIVGNTLESWTFNPRDARYFGSRAWDWDGVILEMDVPAEMIFSTYRTGPGSSIEAEAILLGSVPGSHARIRNLYPATKTAQKGSARSGNWGHSGYPGIGGSSRGSGLHMIGAAPGSNAERRRELARQRRERKPYEQAKGRPTPDSGRDKRTDRLIDDLESHLSSTSLVEKSANAIEDRTDVEYAEIRDVMRTWDFTSNDQDMRALAIQQDVAREFGVPLSVFTQERIDELHNAPGGKWEWEIGKAMYKYNMTREQAITHIETDPAGYGDLFPLMESHDQRKILRATYDNTQDHLRKAGFKPGDTIRVYRGVGINPEIAKDWGAGDTLPIVGNAIESWSFDPLEGKSFARRVYSSNMAGVVLEMDVPVESVFSTGFTGIGSPMEQEVVLFGSIPGSRARIRQIQHPDRSFSPVWTAEKGAPAAAGLPLRKVHMGEPGPG